MIVFIIIALIVTGIIVWLVVRKSGNKPSCKPSCHPCGGSDGCGGTCPGCVSGQVCWKNVCCTPSCSDSCVGGESDGCGGVCPAGKCSPPKVCYEGKCCTPSCPESCVGGESDGCGGVCPPITCPPPGVCKEGKCCTPSCPESCVGGESDGCGGVCPPSRCPLPSICYQGKCCTPSCSDSCVGGESDGCGGVCPPGSCPSGVCYQGKCCTPSCPDSCIGGIDGCGGECPKKACISPDVCYEGRCCTPKCTDACGGESDGCGGVCPSVCKTGQKCYQNKCCTPSCDPSICITHDDGCGGVCQPFSCDPTQKCYQGKCCKPNCTPENCGDDGCGGGCPDHCSVLGANYKCQGGKCVCNPSCVQGQCGDDGCGNPCTTCPGLSYFPIAKGVTFQGDPAITTTASTLKDCQDYARKEGKQYWTFDTVGGGGFITLPNNYSLSDGSTTGAIMTKSFTWGYNPETYFQAIPDPSGSGKYYIANKEQTVWFGVYGPNPYGVVIPDVSQQVTKALSFKDAGLYDIVPSSFDSTKIAIRAPDGTFLTSYWANNTPDGKTVYWLVQGTKQQTQPEAPSGVNPPNFMGTSFDWKAMKNRLNTCITYNLTPYPSCSAETPGVFSGDITGQYNPEKLPSCQTCPNSSILGFLDMGQIEDGKGGCASVDSLLYFSTGGTSGVDSCQGKKSGDSCAVTYIPDPQKDIGCGPLSYTGTCGQNSREKGEQDLMWCMPDKICVTNVTHPGIGVWTDPRM